MKPIVAYSLSTTTSVQSVRQATGKGVSSGTLITGWAQRSFFSTPQVQAKLQVNAPGDALERQADQVAAKVANGPGLGPATAGPRLQPSSPSIQRKAQQPEGPASAELNGSDLQQGGHPMPAPLQQDMESAMGADLSRVRLHTDAPAAERARGIGAKAFTYGQHIHFNHAEFAPQTIQGRFLIAHELTHTLQQGKAPMIQRAPDPKAVAPVADPVEEACLGAMSGDPVGMSLDCANAPDDPLREAIHAAFNSTDNQWVKSALLKIEPALIAIRNVFEGPFDRSLGVGAPGFPGTYKPLKLQGSIMRGLEQLYKALHETLDPKSRQQLLRKAKAAFIGPLSQVSRFVKDKKIGSLSGFQQLGQAVEDGIHFKFNALDAVLDLALQKSPKPPRKKPAASEGISGGFNRKKLEPAALPGLGVDPLAMAPADGSLGQAVETNMQRDLKITGAAESDFLYINIPALISGKARSDTAMDMWDTIRSYRIKNELLTLFGNHVQHPEDAAAKLAFDAAMAKMETEIGPSVRDMAVSLWMATATEFSKLLTDGKAVAGNLQQEIGRLGLTEVEASALDAKTLKATAAQFQGGVANMLAFKGSLGLSDEEVKAIEALGVAVAKAIAAMLKFVGKKPNARDAAKGAEQLTVSATVLAAAMQQTESIVPAVEGKLAALETKLKPILDRLKGPGQLPLMVPVKRHDVAVTFLGDGPEEEATAFFATKPESRIGIYEDVWGPTGIKDKAGYFNRPEAGERGKMVYEELKSGHGFTESEAKIFASVSCGEGDFHSLNSVDIMRISLGFIQFAGTSFADLLEELKDQNPDYFHDHFEQYGIHIDDPKAPKIPTVKRQQRYIPGADVKHPREDRDAANLVVYDHAARVWVRGLEAMAVLQSDPRYLTLIRTSGKHASMQVAQVKRAMNSYHKITRTAAFTYREVGLEPPDGDKKATFKANEVLKSEMAAYAATATSIGGGNGSGIALEKQLIKAVVATLEVKTMEELQAVPQADIVAVLKKIYQKWSRPELFAKASNNPLSDSNYDGIY